MELLYLLILSASFSVFYLLISGNLHSMSPVALVAFPSLFASVFLFLVSGGRKAIRVFLASPWPDKIKLISAGVFGLAGFQILLLIKRYGYAPPHTDIVLLLSLAPIFTYLIASLSDKRKPGFWIAIAYIFALIGTVATVGNWEKPSTLVPFAKFPVEESFIVLAALCWAISTVIVSGLPGEMRKQGVSLFVFAGAVAALAVLFVFERTGWLQLINPPNIWRFFVMGLFSAILYAALFGALNRANALKVSTAVMAFPVVLTLMHGVDVSLGYWGESPFSFPQVILGVVMISAGITIILFEGRLERFIYALKKGELFWARTFITATSALSFALAVASLLRPQLVMQLSGTLDNGQLYRGAWTLFPYQTLLGSLLLFSSGIVLVSAVRSLLVEKSEINALSALIPGLGLVSAFVVGSTPYVNWTQSVPSVILHSIGTEYVTLKTSDFLRFWGMNPPALLSMGLLAFSVMGLIVFIALRRISQNEASLL